MNATVMPLLSVADLIREPEVQLIDVRSTQEYDSGHIPGAINVPMETLESRLADLNLAAKTVFVCQSGTRAGVACSTAGHHFANALVLKGGTDAWIEVGRPLVRSTRSSKPLQQQALLAAGSINLIAGALALVVSPAWIALNLLVGIGLIVAGATGFCLMAQLLAVMPWNRKPISA